MTDLLDIPMQANNANAATIRDYLKALLTALWREGEEFSGKRPFGDSSWEHELYEALANADLISATRDKYGYLNDFNEDIANELIFKAIGSL